MTRVIDISVPVTESMMTWPGDPAARIVAVKRVGRGDSSNVSELVLGSHAGTHVDPPFHFIDGAARVDELDLGALVGDAVVLDLTDVESLITGGDLAARRAEGAERVLLKTRNSQMWSREGVVFPDRYVSLSVEGARWLVERGVRLVGADFLSIEQAQAQEHPVHVSLLAAGIVLLEGLDLSNVEAGRYTLVCLPLRVEGGDGAPARAVLLAP